jgi:hypothetical protein
MIPIYLCRLRFWSWRAGRGCDRIAIAVEVVKHVVCDRQNFENISEAVLSGKKGNTRLGVRALTLNSVTSAARGRLETTVGTGRALVPPAKGGYHKAAETLLPPRPLYLYGQHSSTHSFFAMRPSGPRLRLPGDYNPLKKKIYKRDIVFRGC